MIQSIPGSCILHFRIILGTALLVLLSSAVYAQTTSAMDGSTPSGLTQGAPAGSYALSGFEDINLFNGNANIRLPLLTMGGRGGASTTMMLPFNIKKWHIETYDSEFFHSDTPTTG